MLAYHKESKTHLDQIIVKGDNNEYHHFIINKIYDYQSRAMRLQVMEIENEESKAIKKRFINIRIRSIFHLSGLATLDMSPEYISYAQNGSNLYYWVQKVERAA